MFKISDLMPREDKFFTLLRTLADQAFESAAHLKDFIETTDVNARQAAGKAMAANSAQAKAISLEITKLLCQTFITPFDREDIQDLTSDLYVIPKIIKKVYIRISMHGLELHQGDFAKQVDVIVKEAAAMKQMVHALTSRSGSKEILKHVSVLRDLENEGDKVLNQLLESLFRDVDDARTLILRKDIYDMLEKVIDRYRDVAGVALQIVLKYS